jgi:hypothetical protein
MTPPLWNEFSQIGPCMWDMRIHKAAWCPPVRNSHLLYRKGPSCAQFGIGHWAVALNPHRHNP